MQESAGRTCRVREDYHVRQVRPTEAEMKPEPIPPVGGEGHDFVLIDRGSREWKCANCLAVAFSEPQTRVIPGCVCAFCRPCGTPIVVTEPVR
jgi:hypothetical protein